MHFETEEFLPGENYTLSVSVFDISTRISIRPSGERIIPVFNGTGMTIDYFTSGPLLLNPLSSWDPDSPVYLFINSPHVYKWTCKDLTEKITTACFSSNEVELNFAT